MTPRIATAWAAYLEREGPFTGSALHEPAAEVAAKRAFFAGADEVRVIARSCAMEPSLDAELADFARARAEGKA